MRYALIFPGQGSQSVGMGREFYENFSSAKELLESASQRLDLNFKELLFTQNDNINISQFTQPAIVLNSFMAYLALKSSVDITPVISLGHSLGEFSALGVSGAFEFTEAIKLVNLRGKFMAEACEGKNAAMMVILGLADDKIEEICNSARENSKLVWAANFNCDGQVVVAGNRDDLASLESEFKIAGAKRAMLLNMSVASHCPMLDSASRKLAWTIEPLIRGEFSSVISNVTAKSYSSKSEALKLLGLQLTSPVLYKQSIANVEDEVDCFVEFGASVLKGINKKITDKPTFSIFDLKSLEEFVNFTKENR